MGWGGERNQKEAKVFSTYRRKTRADLKGRPAGWRHFNQTGCRNGLGRNGKAEVCPSGADKAGRRDPARIRRVWWARKKRKKSLGRCEKRGVGGIPKLGQTSSHSGEKPNGTFDRKFRKTWERCLPKIQRWALNKPKSDIVAFAVPPFGSSWCFKSSLS